MKWQQLASDSGPLVDVRGCSAEGGGYLELAFVFERAVLQLTPIDDTDEIKVAVNDTVDEKVLPERPPPFADVLGMVLEYGWDMTNHRGYRDAFQMRLLDLVLREERTWQFEVAASAIRVCDVKPQ